MKLEFDSAISANNHQSALTDANSLSTPFSVKDILSFVDQTEENIDCGPIVSHSHHYLHANQPTMDYGGVDNQYLCHSTAATAPPHYYPPHYHHHHAGSQFGYSDLCDYNANYYNNSYYNGHGYNQPRSLELGTLSEYGLSEASQKSLQLDLQSPPLAKKPAMEFSPNQQTPVRPAMSLISPHDQHHHHHPEMTLGQLQQQMPTDDDASGTRKFYKYSMTMMR